MIQRLFFFSACTILLLFTSCEKELKVNIPAGASKLVVEGAIENNNYPYVVLSNSIGFFDKIDLGSIKYEKGANITVTDLTTGFSMPLKEYSFDTLVNGQVFTFVIYGPDFFSANLDSIKGRLNHSYKLSINSKGQIYESITKVTDCVLPDSVWLEPIPKTNDTAFKLRILYNDPDTNGNYLRYRTQALRKNKSVGASEEFLTNFGSVFDDAFITGQTLPFYLDLGYSKNIDFSDTTQRKIFDYQSNIYRGDTVNIEWSGIDFDTYNFWTTLEYSRNSTGNPFASPTKVASNVKNAIGIWGGYGTKTFSIIAPN